MDGAACECGAGIGRVSRGLLLPLGVPRCDLVESSEKLLSQAPAFIGDPESSRCRFLCQGLQEWTPLPNTYSIIWIQWVLCYLTDDDIVAFLKRCGKALIAHGVIVLKENTCEGGETFVLDKDDASVTRSLPYWLQLIEDSGLRLIQQEMQRNFPEELFPVPMLALEVNPDLHTTDPL
jgi:protein N-terminal methyltransferase